MGSLSPPLEPNSSCQKSYIVTHDIVSLSRVSLQTSRVAGHHANIAPPPRRHNIPSFMYVDKCLLVLLYEHCILVVHNLEPSVQFVSTSNRASSSNND